MVRPILVGHLRLGTSRPMYCGLRVGLGLYAGIGAVYKKIGEKATAVLSLNCNSACKSPCCAQIALLGVVLPRINKVFTGKRVESSALVYNHISRSCMSSPKLSLLQGAQNLQPKNMAMGPQNFPGHKLKTVLRSQPQMSFGLWL